MSNHTLRSIIVLPASQQAAANDALRALAGGDTFRAGLSADGSEPPTHYWSSWQLTPEERTEAGLLLLVAAPLATIHDLDSPDPAAAAPTTQAVLAQHGLQPVSPPREVS